MLHNPCDLMEVQVNGDRSFFVAKDVLLCRCGRLLREYLNALKAAKMENDEAEEEDDDDELSVRMLLHDLPGGAKAFEMVVDFCYGDVKLKIGVENVVYLRCAAQYLEMSEKYGPGNLIQKTEAFLSGMATWSWKEIVTVLQSCDAISRSADDAGIIQKCIETLAGKAFDMSAKVISSNVVSPSIPISVSSSISCSPKPFYPYSSKQTASPSCRSSNSSSPLPRRIIHHKSSSDVLPYYAAVCGSSPQPSAPMSWWCEDPSPLSIHLMDRLVLAMIERRVEHRHVARFLLRYLEGSLQISPGYSSLPHTFDAGEKILFENAQKLQRQSVEMVVRFLYCLEWDSLPVKCLFELRRVSMAANVSSLCKNQLEKMIGSQLHKASLDNILVPQFSCDRENKNCSYDVDFILRLVKLFLLSGAAEKLQVKSGQRKVDMDGTSAEGDYNDYYDDNCGIGSPLKTVATLMDMFLAEIAPDMYLEASRFVELAQALPCTARDTHDSLYKAVDIYIQAHPRATLEDIDQLFGVIDFEKLSAEACKHAMLNPRIPVRFTFHILAAQQDELRNVVEAGVQNSRRTSAESNDAVYPCSYASLVKQNEELRSDLQSMHAKVTKLERMCTALRSQLSQDVWLG